MGIAFKAFILAILVASALCVSEDAIGKSKEILKSIIEKPDSVITQEDAKNILIGLLNGMIAACNTHSNME